MYKLIINCIFFLIIMAKFVQLNKLNKLLTPKVNVNTIIKVLPIYSIIKRNDIKPKKS